MTRRTQVTRTILCVSHDYSKVHDEYCHADKKGRHPRLYRRIARAENMSIEVCVVIADVPDPE